MIILPLFMYLLIMYFNLLVFKYAFNNKNHVILFLIVMNMIFMTNIFITGLTKYGYI
jgi:hypothetical protein